MVVEERDVCLQREENGGVYIGFWQFQIAEENNGRKDNKKGQNRGVNQCDSWRTIEKK